MTLNKSSLIKIIILILVIATIVVLISSAIWVKYFHARPLLPTTECPPTANELRARLKTDTNPIPSLAAPAPSHQPTRPVKGSWQNFKDKQALRKEQAQMPQSQLGEWKHRPKGAAYWRKYGAQMRQERTWLEKLKDKVGL